ncbi:MAG: hypothetical protein JSV89_21610 [Spirochaetaceae bacterium]|nr:MAG: hypothetical protein JSV89_21610 [Spirochaetaceae bacterium]
MTAEDRSKLQSMVGEIEGLKSRQPDESKFKDWKEKVEKKLEETFGKGSEQLLRFQRSRFFNFSRAGKPKDAPLSETERREYLQGLDEAKRNMQRYL